MLRAITVFLVLTSLGLAAPASARKTPGIQKSADEMAKGVMRALATGSYEHLDALMTRDTRKELGKITEDNFKDLLKAMEKASIDPTKIKLVKVVVNDSYAFADADLICSEGGKRFLLSVTMVTISKPPQFGGIARWLKVLE